MTSYFRSMRGGLGGILDLPVGAEVDVTTDSLARHPPTFFKRVGTWPGRVAIRSVAANDLPAKHLLRVYEVGRVDNGLEAC